MARYQMNGGTSMDRKFTARAIAYKLGTVFNFQRFSTLMPYPDFACDCLYKSNVLESLDLKSYLR